MTSQVSLNDIPCDDLEIEWKEFVTEEGVNSQILKCEFKGEPRLLKIPLKTAKPDSLVEEAKRSQTVGGHRNLVQVYGISKVADDRIGIVMEYCGLGSLQHFYTKKGSNLSLLEKVNFMIDILNGFSAIHAKGFVHIDLTPENILIKHLHERYVALVCDWGGVYHFSQGPPRVKPRFAAPELLAGEKPNVQMALYSFGCLFYFILTGDMVFANLTQEMIQRKPESRNLSKRAIDKVPPIFQILIWNLLSSEPKNRGNLDFIRSALEFAKGTCSNDLRSTTETPVKAQQHKIEEEVNNALIKGDADLLSIKADGRSPIHLKKTVKDTVVEGHLYSGFIDLRNAQ
eukprot:TRINITY_DN2834_c0_g3_i1.p1 TRINITY_DN2834_c0_g3~~TRINITY_DN2834_c0_g3_i1.p1  ORF type:complete len:343 (-),score=35.61 TRINITY_DN2834_c0_g3_i1:81-1109(-)